MLVLNPATRVDQIFTELVQTKKAASSHEVALNELRVYIASSAKGDWEEDVWRHLLDLVQSKVVPRQYAAVLVIDLILDIIKEDPIDNRHILYRFYNHLTTILQHATDHNLVRTAAKLTGRLVKASGGVLGDHFLEEQIPRFFEMTISDNTSSFAVIHVLREFSIHSPLSFLSHFAITFRCIGTFLRDPQLEVRTAAADFLENLLGAMGPQELDLYRATVKSLILRIQQGLESDVPSILHGSILGYQVLFLSPEKEPLQSDYIGTCESVLRFRSHSDSMIRDSVVSIIPALASYDPKIFIEHIFHVIISFLIQKIETCDAPTAYLSIGHLTSVVGESMEPYIDDIFEHAQLALRKQSDRNSVVKPDHIFKALSLMIRALGSTLGPMINKHLELFFTCGLSEALIEMLHMAVRHIPALLTPIQERLLNLLSIILSGRPFAPPGARQDSEKAERKGLLRGTSPTQIILALSVLTNFDFKEHSLSEFVVQAVLPHLNDDDVNARRGAAASACKVLSRDRIRFQSSQYALEIITHALDRLLSAAIVDTDSTVRKAVLSSLEENLDYQLAQGEYVRLLLLALHDEMVDNRILAMGIIGRLANHNPSSVLPPMKKMLVQLLTELRYSITVQNKEDAIRLLAALVSSAHAVVEKDVPDILDVLLGCSTDTSVVVKTSVLICLGELATLEFNEWLSERLDQIMTIILASLEGSAQIRSAALDCLGKLCTHMGYVIAPIEDYPPLLPLLHGMLKREQSAGLRQQVIRVIGLLGALDPDRYQTRVQKLVLTELQPELINIIPPGDAEDSKAVTSDDPYQDKVTQLLLDILQQQAFNSHHHLVVNSFVSIANAKGTRFAVVMPKIVPTLCSVIRNSSSSLQRHYLAQLTSLITAVREHTRSCLKDIINLVNDLWDVTSQRLTLIILVETLAYVLAAEIGKYTTQLVSRLLLILQEEKIVASASDHARAVTALIAFGPNLQEHLNLVIPVLIACFRHSTIPSALRKQAIDSLSELSKAVDLYPYASRVIHSLEEVLIDTSTSEPLRQAVVDAFATFTYTLGSSMVIFVPSLTKIINEKHIPAPVLLDSFSQMLNGHAITQPPIIQQPAEVAPAVPARIPNANLLKQAWDISRVLKTHEAWISWFTELVAQFVKESPSVSLQACMNLFDAYPHIAAELFSPALASCWKDLTEPFQEDFVHVIQHVVSFPGVPPEVAHYMLNVVEDMERNNTPLRVSHGQMAEYCFNLRAYAKALHHRELQFFQDFAPSTIESLIEINAMLRQSDAALGTLNLARQHYEIRNPESWYEKLGQWNEALQLYQGMDNRDHMEVERANDSLLGQLRCLHALGEWEQVTALTSRIWEDSDEQLRMQLAPLGAAGAWQTESWDELEKYYSVIDTTNGDRYFYETISAIQKNRLPNALVNITKARDLLDPEFTSLLDESPDRLDRFAVQAQMISELEELILYKKLADRPRKQRKLRETWKKRLLGCQKDINVWQRILKVRSLSVKSEDDIDTTVQFANLCWKSGRFYTAHRAMEPLVRSEEHGSKAPPPIVYTQLKIIWHNGEHQKAFFSLRRFIQELSQSPQLDDPSTRPAISHVLSRCYLKHGTWQAELEDGLTPSNATSILTSYHLATVHNPQWSKAWHTWALANLDMIRTPYALQEMAEETVSDRLKYVVAAVEGFFRSLALTSRDNLPDTLNLLTLWFKYGGYADVDNTVAAGIKSANCAMWLDVVPQIIARIQTPIPAIRATLTRLLTEIGKEHPQCLVYALNVAAKSPSAPRKAAATKILNHMCTHSRILVEQANLVERELSRVAVSWSEMWYEAIQKLARHYFAGNSAAILEVLQTLHEQLDAPSTPFEVEFKEVIGLHLLKAKALCQRHVANGEKKHLDQAWSLYLRVYQQVEHHRPEIQPPTRGRSPKSLDLHTVSPVLVHAMNLDLAIPGTYVNGVEVVKIAGFKTQVTYLPTKQRPRKLTILGNNGQQYLFLLKGFEDLRQDERVMQVFGLVNTLLARNRECLDRRLHLQRYSVVPLAPDVGLIGWIADIDPLQNLILEYRANHGILPDLEHRLILQEEPDFDTTAPLPKKLRAFESALKRTTGQDLYRIFWLKSPNSEVWVTRRTTYTRSLAVGNMICYLLGIGDRHPGNIIIDRKTGKVIHIDFGDCFEVSFEREQLPEKVPFRLTRMLRHAMEVCGIQGGFRMSCELSLDVFRENKESLLAVLEAFIYDPLINWRLVRTETHTGGGVASSLGSISNSPSRRPVLNEDEILADVSPSGGIHESRNERALAVYSRVEDKLTGRDFGADTLLTVGEQVERLVREATSNENLCQLFHGWCPFW